MISENGLVRQIEQIIIMRHRSIGRFARIFGLNGQNVRRFFNRNVNLNAGMLATILGALQMTEEVMLMPTKLSDEEAQIVTVIRRMPPQSRHLCASVIEAMARESAKVLAHESGDKMMAV